MKLNITTRVDQKKSDAKKIRREGGVPAVLYAHNQPVETITISQAEIKAVFRALIPGRLSTTIFTLVQDGKEVQAIVKDIQYNLTTYDVVHMDFQKLVKETTVTVKVPIECVGMADCAGIKLGGFLRSVIRSTPVVCPSNAIPSHFTLDISTLGMRQTKKIADVVMPENVKPLAKMQEVVVVIAKR